MKFNLGPIPGRINEAHSEAHVASLTRELHAVDERLLGGGGVTE